MAASTSSFMNRSFCLYCKTSSQINSEKEFHDIFDKIGTELQLPNLVEKFFNVKVGIGRNKQLLCEDCVNSLIELFDLAEHSKQLEEAQCVAEQTQALEYRSLNESAAEEKEFNKEQLFLDNDDSNGLVEETVQNNAKEIGESNNFLNVEHDYDVCLENESDVEEDADAVVNDGDVSNHFHNLVENDIKIEDELQHKLESLDENATIEIECAFPQNSSEEGDQYSNELQVEVDDTSNKNPKNSEYSEVIIEEQLYDAGAVYYIEEEVQGLKANSDNNDEASQEAQYYEEYDDSTMDAVPEDNDDNIIIDEEYLIEETICSEEYDNVDLCEYLDSAIKTKFEDLVLPFTIECRFCGETFTWFQVLLKRHSCVDEVFEEQRNCCIVKDCEEIVNDLRSLGRHLLTMHHENVESLTVYGRCPECKKSFSNLVDWNKHSCCILKRKPGIRNFCQACNMDFQSQKRYVFHMQFHLTKHRPKICLLCGCSFNNATEFFEHVNYSHEPKSTMACIRCDRFFKEKAVYDRHIQAHESKIHFECTYCPKKYTNRTGLASHMDIYHNHKTKPLQCEYCNKQFVSQASYRSHIKIHMPETYVPAFICSHCGLISNNSETLKTHIETEEERNGVMAEILEKEISVSYTCENCSVDFFSASQLQEHRKASNHTSKFFYCPICRKVFRTLQHMRNHMASHKDYDEWQSAFPIGRFYMCDIGNCRDAYPLWTSLYYHKKRHKSPETSAAAPMLGDGRYICQFCDKLCPTKMSLAIHVARVHNNSHVKCPQCQKMYKNDDDLKKHIDHMHTSIECPSCERVFKSRRNLLSHEHLVHKNEKRYFCRHCTKGYYYKSEMEAHERNVHPDTSYKCDVCHFSTNYEKSLQIHMAKHDNKLPFRCSLCGKTFGRKQLLKIHEKRHMKTKEFVCQDYCRNGCELSFVRFSLMEKHIRRKHSEENDSKYIRRRQKTNNNTATKRKRKGPVILVQDEKNSVELVLNQDEDTQETAADMDDMEYEFQYEYEEIEDLDENNDDDDVDMEMSS